MRSLLTVVVILSVALLLVDGTNIIRQVRRAKAKAIAQTGIDAAWDVMPDGVIPKAVAWFKGKGKGHEKLIPAVISAKLDNDALIDGIRWNDLPTSDGRPLGGIAFGLDFTAGEKPDTADHNTIVFNTHFGCLQHWHSMAPSVEPESKGVTPSNQIMFTNAEVRSMIRAQAAGWWNDAVAAKDAVSRSRKLAHLLHMVTDSYPQGHVVRDTTNVAYPLPAGVTVVNTVTLPTTCGNVVYFMGYPPEHGNDAHGDHDHEATGTDRNGVLFSCAKYAAHALTAVFESCAAGTTANCAFPTALFNAIYSLGTHGGLIAGGALNGFQGPTAGTDYTKTTVGTFEIWIPKSAKRRADATATHLCPFPIKAREYGSVADSSNNRDFSDFVNPDLKSNTWWTTHA